MDIVFTATEAGYANGIASASNQRGIEAFHYVQFGRPAEVPAAGKAGHFFEFDDRGNRSVNEVVRVSITNGGVEFDLKRQKIFIFHHRVGEAEWAQFMRGIAEVFGAAVVQVA